MLFIHSFIQFLLQQFLYNQNNFSTEWGIKPVTCYNRQTTLKTTMTKEKVQYSTFMCVMVTYVYRNS